MNYVEKFNLFGVEARQKPCLTGTGAPKTSTEGAVGELYMDTDTGALYKCVSVGNGGYVWEPAGSGGGSADLSNYYTKDEVNELTLLPGTNLYDKSGVIDGYILANNPNSTNLLQTYANGILSGYVEVSPGSTYVVTNGNEDNGNQLYVGAVFFFDQEKKPFCAISIAGATHGSWAKIDGNAIVTGDGIAKTITILNPNIKYIMWYVTPSSLTNADSRNFYGSHTGTDTIVNRIQMNEGVELLPFTEYGLSEPIKNKVLENSKEIEELKKNKSDNTSVHFVKSGENVQFRSGFGENDIGVRAVLNGSKSNSFNLSGYYTIPKETEMSDINTGTVFKNAGDDITPLYFANTYIGANHGIARVYKATFASSHGLTEANIGETWNISSDKDCMILQVPSNTEIVIGKPKNDVTGFDGINVATVTSLTKNGVTLTPSNVAGTQLWPAENHISVKVVDEKGEEISENGVYNGMYFDVVESYDLPYIPSVTAHLAANIGNNNNNSVADESITDKYCTVNIIYRFTERGAITVYQTVDFDKTLTSVRAGFVQSASIGQYFAVPGTNYNIVSKQSGAVDLSNDIWTDQECPPDRFYQFNDEAQTAGMCIGYCSEYGNADPSVRKNQTNAGRYETSYKVYPYVQHDGAVDNTTSITAISYRTPLNQYDSDIPAVSWYYVGDDIYLLIDVQKSVNKYLKLPDYMNGRKAEVLKSFGNITIPHPFVVDKGFKVITDSYGSAVIKLTK